MTLQLFYDEISIFHTYMTWNCGDEKILIVDLVSIPIDHQPTARLSRSNSTYIKTRTNKSGNTLQH